jgi:hypothetical protein
MYLAGYAIQFQAPDADIPCWAVLKIHRQCEESKIIEAMQETVSGCEVLRIRAICVERCVHCGHASEISEENCMQCGRSNWRPELQDYQFEYRENGEWKVAGRGRFTNAQAAIDALDDFNIDKNDLRIRKYNPDDHDESEYTEGMGI